eukprot:scpid105057/ scgid23447/ 
MKLACRLSQHDPATGVWDVEVTDESQCRVTVMVCDTSNTAAGAALEVSGEIVKVVWWLRKPERTSDTSTLPNYQLISLLAIISKVMEGIVNTQLVNYLEKHEALPNSQFGF